MYFLLMDRGVNPLGNIVFFKFSILFVVIPDILQSGGIVMD
jgi:hypothetical protein